MTKSKAGKTDPRKRHLRGLPSRIRTTPREDRIRKIRDLASAILEEASSLEYEGQLGEVNALITRLKTGSIDFSEEVQRFEITLITRSLELARGNQTRAAKLLGLRTTTFNYKVKIYGLL